MNLSREEATFVIGRVWDGSREPDAVFRASLRVLGLSERHFLSLKAEARRVEHRFPRRVTLTPTSVGKRR